MKSRKVKVLSIIAGIIVLLAVIIFTALQIYLRRPLPDYTGKITIDGLRTAAEVRTDEHGVPHIFAGSEDDLFFLQGYITARERLFQMDLTRLAGRGELSTFLGEATVKADKLFKTIGFYRAAEEEYRLLPPEIKAHMNSYTRGVNACLASARLPIEYTILRVQPEPWKPQDCLVAGLLMAYSLNRPKDTELILYQIGLKAGKDLLKYIIPDLPGDTPLVSGGKVSDALPAGRGGNVSELKESGGRLGGFFFPLSTDVAASNWMIFHGSRTTTGKAVFTGSPDLQPKIPALFYLVHLQGGRYDVIGGSIPGLPGVNVLGFNRRIAWSTTNGRGDELDYFIEKLNPANPDQYLTEKGYQNFKLIEETLKIKAKGGIREEKITIKVSRHGPIISNVMPGAPPNCAMQWVGLQSPTGLFEGLLGMIRAADFDEFRKSLSLVRTPTLNFGYADVDGNIGYQYVMAVPIRKKGDGTLPVPGDSGDYEWKGFVPFDKLPYDYNPPQGYVGSFNNPPKAVSYHITRYFMFERALRFNTIASSKEKFTPAEIRNMQLDAVSAVAGRWTPLIIAASSGAGDLQAYLEVFKGWKYSMDIHSQAATLFSSFYTHFIRNTLEDNIGSELCAKLLTPYLVYQPDMMLANIINDNSHFLYDDTRTTGVKETRDDIIRKSMGDAVKELKSRLGPDPRKWEWGQVHTMTFKHPLGSKLAFFNLKPVPANGDGFTINAGLWESQNPYAMDSGGVIRMVIDMSNLESVTLTSPPGQSGQYMSPYYKDLASGWAKGEQIPAHFLTARRLPQLLTFEPGKPEVR